MGSGAQPPLSSIRTSREQVAPVWKAAWAVALTGVAGWVDCGGYMWAAEILTANQSGNTVEIAVSLFAGKPYEVWLRVATLGSFFAGLLGCALIHDWMERRGIKSTASATLFMEALLLIVATVLVGGDQRRMVLLISLGLAMGLQNATLTRVGALNVRTTHVTGTISELAESLAAYWFWARERTLAAVARESAGQKHFRWAVVTLCLWCAFLLGAAGFLAARMVLDRFALLPAVALLLAATAFDLYRPMRKEEKKKDVGQ